MDRTLNRDATAGSPRLPQLRQDLSLLRTSDGPNGQIRYLIHDPVGGRFHRISDPIAKILSQWGDYSIADFAARLTDKDAIETDTIAQLQTLLAFLSRNRLIEAGSSQQSDHLASLEADRRRPWHEILLHKYLYIRIPLFRPQAWLDRLLPWLEPWFRPSAGFAVAIMGLIGFYLAARQWDDFVTTFSYFFTPAGLVFYAITLLIIKSLHELGHAITARRAGVAVPVIGVAFLVLFPILYTDTTDAWRLKDRRSRLLIDAGGVIVELIIACLALLAWSLLPDGPLRSAAFFTATTSWTMSLLVNLNPCMRFDGYYLLSDWLGIENLQERGFALARWQMRKALLGLTTPQPQEQRPRLLCLYAYSTWIYRLFLFIGIALLVHHIFPKAIGIVLFCAEIGVFILRPIARELTHWWRHKMLIVQNWRGRLSAGVVLAGLISLFIPWQTKIIAPALLRPAQQTDIPGQPDTQVADILVERGQSFKAGEVLLILESDTLSHEFILAQRALALANIQSNQQAANRRERRQSALRQDELVAARSRVETIERKIEKLTIRAPFSGHVASLHPGLESGFVTSGRLSLMRLHGHGTELIALPVEADRHRIKNGQSIRFISDRIGIVDRQFQINHMAETATHMLALPLLSAVGGGTIAVTDNQNGDLIPHQPLFRVSATSEETQSGTERGVAVISAKAQAPITPIKRRVIGILLRETDF